MRMMPLVVSLLMLQTQSAAQPHEATEAVVLAHLKASCPSASRFELGVPLARVLSLRDLAPHGLTPVDWSHPAEPWPVVISSPDSLAFARVTVIDSPPQIFVSSLVDSIGYANYQYLSSWHLLTAAWLDNHRFLLILAPHVEFTELSLQVTVADFARREEYLWHPEYEGQLPETSAIASKVAELESRLEDERAGR
jgi:hypothetical protein